MNYSQFNSKEFKTSEKALEDSINENLASA
jgi:hypothetical protein